MPRRSVSNKAMSLLASPTTTRSSFLTLRSICSPCTAPMYRGLKQGDFSGWLTRSTTTWMMSCKPAGRRSFRICSASAQKHPDDALLQAAARVVQSQAAAVKKDKPVAVAADGKKTAGRQALKVKQWLEHQYRQEYTAEGLCPHCGTVYADRPAAMPVPYSHAAGCQASAELVIEYANMTACGIPMHRSDVICGSDTVEQLATENFGRPVQMWATDGIGGILTEQIKAVARQAE